jgi:potassium-transporting ATPase KdpC subunit
MKTILPSIRIFAVLTILTGVLYPLAVTGVSWLFFRDQASGSLILRDGKAVGSELLAQKFESERYFWPRQSAADFATVPSGASNKGPTSADLVKAIGERRAKFGVEAPSEVITASGSGLDPHISPEAARLQIPSVAKARGVEAQRVAELVERAIEPPQFGLFGEPRVNVLMLNIALDTLK